MFETLTTHQPWTIPGYPQQPAGGLDWSAASRISAIAALADVPQDPMYHAEGDVLTHTRLVLEALVALPAWQALPERERMIVFGATLLHDIGKVATTAPQPDGHIGAPNHARIGAQQARQTLWRGEGLAPVPFGPREAITRLVRLHGLPLWSWDRSDLTRRIIGASLVTRLDWLALVAEADVRGRICNDQAALLERVELFRALAADLGCLDQPFIFANAHSRFVYFQREDASAPPYAAFDDTVCDVTILSGLPGTGKDTWVARHAADQPVIALDAIRRELGIDPGETQGAVAHAARDQLRRFLRQHQDVVFNATSVTRHTRDPLIALCAAYHARVRIVYLDTTWAELQQRNRTRPTPVPAAVLNRLSSRLEVPDLTEAQEVEWLFQ